MTLEPRSRPAPRPREILASLSATHVSNGLIAFIFAASGPVAIILAAGLQGGLSHSDLASWIFAAFAINGALSIALSIAYRTPLAFFWTIPGTVLVGHSLTHLTFEEVIGAFIATGILLLVLGLTGLVRRIMDHLPMPIVMAMVAGVFLSFGLDWITAFQVDLWIAMPMTAAFLVLSFSPVAGRFMPPMIGVLIVGVAAVALQGATAEPGELASEATASILVSPNLYVPAVSLGALLELVVPLAITVLAAQNAQGVAILEANGHRPPVNTITTACGATSLVTAPLGCVSTCLTGPSNAIISSGGDPKTQYVAAIVLACFAICFGLLAPLFIDLMLSAPPAFIATLAGLALLRVLQTAFQTAFGQRFSLGALITFMVTVADVSILNIGAPFWGLVFGYLTSLFLERHDLVERKD
jgi:benzoate membrane transport protein